jgi:carbonic anhydrase
VANVVVHTDLNCLSVMQFAVDVLRVKHIIVCGHYGCGGVRAAYDGAKLGLIDNWLRHVQDVAHKHTRLLQSVNDTEKFDRLCELNVLEQAVNVCATTVVQDAWARGASVTVDALIYRLTDGLLRSLAPSVSSPQSLSAIYSAAIGQEAAGAPAGRSPDVA